MTYILVNIHIYMYIIYCKLLIENTKKWDLALHSGIVEMKGNKEKKLRYMCMYLLTKLTPQKTKGLTNKSRS